MCVSFVFIILLLKNCLWKSEHIHRNMTKIFLVENILKQNVIQIKQNIQLQPALLCSAPVGTLNCLFSKWIIYLINWDAMNFKLYVKMEKLGS